MTFTTIEKLEMRASSYGAVLKYGDKVFFTDLTWNGDFTAEIYEFVETPEETGLGDIECRIQIIEKADKGFDDNGHAIAWCFSRV